MAKTVKIRTLKADVPESFYRRLRRSPVYRDCRTEAEAIRQMLRHFLDGETPSAISKTRNCG